MDNLSLILAGVIVGFVIILAAVSLGGTKSNSST
jgi:hypothetical protein